VKYVRFPNRQHLTVYLLRSEGDASEQSAPQQEDEGHGEQYDVAVGGDHQAVHGYPALLYTHQGP
jgi:hypothetical protein